MSTFVKISANYNKTPKLHSDNMTHLVNAWSEDVFKHIIKLGSFCRLFDNTQANSSHGISQVDYLKI